MISTWNVQNLYRDLWYVRTLRPFFSLSNFTRKHRIYNILWHINVPNKQNKIPFNHLNQIAHVIEQRNARYDVTTGYIWFDIHTCKGKLSGVKAYHMTTGTYMYLYNSPKSILVGVSGPCISLTLLSLVSAWKSNCIRCKCRMIVLIHSQTSTIEPLKFGNGYAMSSYTWYVIAYLSQDYSKAVSIEGDPVSVRVG